MNAASWLIDTVTVKRQTGIDNFGDPSFGAAREVRARVETTDALVTGTDGDDKQARFVVVTAEALDVEDRIWLPGADTADATEALRPLTVKTARTKLGDYQLWEAYV